MVKVDNSSLVYTLVRYIFASLTTKNQNQKQQRTVKSARKNLPYTPKPPSSKNKPNTSQRVKTLPVAMARQFRTGEPSMRRTKNSVIIHHKEYLTDLYGNTANTFPTPGSAQFVNHRINPSNQGMFPWLSGVAKCYETYLFKKLIISYETATSTGVGGKVLLAVDYDAADLPPDNTVKVMSMEGSVKSPTWSEAYHVSTAANLHKQKIYYTNFDRSTDGDNLRQNDVGNFYAIAIGQGNANIIGDLYVEYDVELTTPQLDTGDGWLVENDFTTMDFVAAGKTGNLAIVVTGSSSVRLEQELLCSIIIVQHGTGITTAPTVAVSGGTGSVNLDTYVGISTEAMAWYKAKLNPGAVLTFAAGTHTTLSRFSVLISEIPTSIYTVL